MTKRVLNVFGTFRQGRPGTRTNWHLSPASLPVARMLAVTALAIAVTALMSERVAAASQCGSFDVYILAQTWPESQCLTLKSDAQDTCLEAKPDNAWSIHGLWPSSLTPGGYPRHCKGADFSRDALAGLLPQLTAAWPNLGVARSTSADAKSAVDNDYSFWRYEWEKHGICATVCDTNIGSQHDYFAQALSLYDRYDIGKVLDAAGIVPDSTATITASSVSNAVSQAYGATPALSCTYDKDKNSTNLNGLWLCLKPGSFDPVDCPADEVPEHSRCPADVLLPAAPSP